MALRRGGRAPFSVYGNGDEGPASGLPDMPRLPPSAIGGIIAVAIVLWGLSSSYYTVQPEERAVVKRFGAVIPDNPGPRTLTGAVQKGTANCTTHEIADPGLHF